MENENLNETPMELPGVLPVEPKKLANASYLPNAGKNADFLWNPEDVDKMEIYDIKEYRKVVEACKFFYKRDPIASSVINKMIELGINDILFKQNGLSANEIRVFYAIKRQLLDFSEQMAQEYLLSGLVIPEVSITLVNKQFIKENDIKKYETLYLPTDMWVRNPEQITINSSMFGGKDSFYLEIPDDLIYFITNEGTYKDGTKDKTLYVQLNEKYPEFIIAVKNGQRKVLIENDSIFRRRELTDSPYPVPYLYPALESMKHKRNLRRMDYSTASRVIGAIQLIKVGSDLFPVTEDNEDVLDDLKSKMLWRGSGNIDIEKVFQLFTNHTVTIEWVIPPIDALLDDKKYANVNKDILYSLGFPQILIMGENERSGSGGANEAALFSPTRTIDNMREKIRYVLQKIIYEICIKNNFKNVPTIYFKPLNMVEFRLFAESLRELYDTGNLSRTSYADFMGYSWDDEMNLREDEEKVLKQKNLTPMAIKPYSPIPGQESQNPAENPADKKNKSLPPRPTPPQSDKNA